MRNEGHNAYDSNPHFGLPDNSDTVAAGRRRQAALRLEAGGFTCSCRPAAMSTRSLQLPRRHIRRLLRQHAATAPRCRATSVARRAAADAGFRLAARRGSVAGTVFQLRVRRAAIAPAFAQYQGRLRPQRRAGERCATTTTTSSAATTTGSLAWGIDARTACASPPAPAPRSRRRRSTNCITRSTATRTCGRRRRDSIEARHRPAPSAWHWRLNAYETAIDDLIIYDTTHLRREQPGTARASAARELTARRHVARHGMSRRRRASSIRATAATATTSTSCCRAARAEADAWTWTATFGAWLVGGTWIAEGGRWDDVANTLHVGGYATLDLRAQFACHTRLDRCRAKCATCSTATTRRRRTTTSPGRSSRSACAGGPRAEPRVCRSGVSCDGMPNATRRRRHCRRHSHNKRLCAAYERHNLRGAGSTSSGVSRSERSVRTSSP